jgi:hypothetical protein
MDNYKSATLELNTMLIKRFGLALGIVGLGLAIIGNLYPDTQTQKVLYLLGGILLTITAVIEGQAYFIALEAIVIVSASLAFIPGYFFLKAMLPLALTALFLLYLNRNPHSTEKVDHLGTCGLVLLALGYAITHPLLYLAGGIVLTVYSYRAYRAGVSIALLWAVLNAVFSLTAFYAVYSRLIMGDL